MSVGDNTKGTKRASERDLKLLAMQIVIQLPKDQAEAHEILELAKGYLVGLDGSAPA